jgi:hypothetical protein
MRPSSGGHVIRAGTMQSAVPPHRRTELVSFVLRSQFAWFYAIGRRLDRRQVQGHLHTEGLGHDQCIQHGRVVHPW